MFQIGTSSWGGTRKLPYVFTEQGIAMLSGILNSDRAILVNIQFMRVFTKLREMLSTHEELKKKFEEWEKKYDARLNKIDGRVQTVLEAFEEIKRLLNPPIQKKNKIGFL
jgi:predicted nucleotide-binding protein (sugar kinase/HSP70/actin superfamily)